MGKATSQENDPVLKVLRYYRGLELPDHNAIQEWEGIITLITLASWYTPGIFSHGTHGSGCRRQEAAISVEGAICQLQGRKCHNSTSVHTASKWPEQTAYWTDGARVAVFVEAQGQPRAVVGIWGEQALGKP